MTLKPVVVGLLAAGCVTAAAGGAYLAVRHNQSDVTAASAAAPAASAVRSPAVAETEAVVTPSAAPAPSAAQPVERATVPEPAPAAVATPAKPERTTKRTEARTPVSQPAPRPARSPERAPAPPQAAVPDAPDASAASAPREQAAAPAPLPAVDPAEPARVPEHPPAPRVPELVEVVVPAYSVMGLQVDTPLSSERARVEDRVEARVTRDVSADGRIAIPAGSRVVGAVTLVERGGKMKDRARLGIRFHTLVLADGTEIPIRTESFYRDGESPAGESARKVGGAAVAGAVIGAIIGGGKGAAIGGATGAAGGTAAVMAGDRNAATLPAGTVVSVRLASPVSLTVDRE